MLKSLLTWLLALVLIAGSLLFFESDFLWKTQELNLFLTTPEFFSQQMVVSGGFLTYVGTFFTQFLAIPWLGVLILCGLWYLLMWMTRRAFRVSHRWSVLMLIPVALILLTIVDMGYWVYLLKLRGHFFVTTLGVTAVVALLWAFRCLPSRFYLRAIFIILVVLVGYPLLGIYALAATVVMGVWTWQLATKGESAVNTFVAILSVVALPLFYYRFVYHETNLVNIYWTELPLFRVMNEHHVYYLPYYLLLLFFILMAVCYQKDHLSLSLSQGEGTKKQSNRLPLGEIREGLRVALLFLAIAYGVFHFWYKDENFHHELKMQRCIDRADWSGVMDEAARQQDEPTRAIVMMRNLALSRLDQQGSMMYQYRNGSKPAAAPFGISMMQLFGGTLFYYQYGLLNYCNRMCMELGVEFDWRPEYIKYMAKCATLEGDQQVARKYLGILHHTLFFEEWATQMEPLVGNPQAIAQNTELEPITHMLHYQNQLTSDGGMIEQFIMRQLAYSTDASDPYFQEQALLASLWVKDPRAFWARFADYIRLHPGKDMPIHYQEAAYFFGYQEGRNLSNVPFDQRVKDSYASFIQVASKYDDQEITEVRNALYPLFGNTFYYDYYLMSNLQPY